MTSPASFTFPLIFRALEIAFEELVAAGYPPEIALMELHGSGELGQVLSRAADVGLYEMLEADGSPACRFGVLTHCDRVIDATALAASAKATIERIRTGAFARERLDDERSSHPQLEELTSQGALPLDIPRSAPRLVGSVSLARFARRWTAVRPAGGETTSTEFAFGAVQRSSASRRSRRSEAERSLGQLMRSRTT